MERERQGGHGRAQEDLPGQRIHLDEIAKLDRLPRRQACGREAGLANDFQLDFFLEQTLPDVLEPTFDEDGIKMLPLPEMTMVQDNAEKEVKVAGAPSTKEEDIVAAEESVSSIQEAIAPELGDLDQGQELIDCKTAEECWERVEQVIWQNRTVVPALDGILLPSRSVVSP